jgi:hypothetical protein
LWSLTPPETWAEHDATNEPPFVDATELERVAEVVVPDLVGPHAVKRGKLLGAQQKVNGRGRLPRPVVVRARDRLRRAKPFREMPTFRVPTQS